MTNPWNPLGQYINGLSNSPITGDPPLYHPLGNAQTVRTHCHFYDKNYEYRNKGEHAGIDFLAKEKSNVYPVWVGKVLVNYTKGHDVESSYVAIEHYAFAAPWANIGDFIAYYGHITSPLQSGEIVLPNQIIGTVKLWTQNKSETHLHLGFIDKRFVRGSMYIPPSNGDTGFGRTPKGHNPILSGFFDPEPYHFGN